ncbi:MAG: hypothetical protein QX199_15325 [Methylococcaceae bacterium]
MQTARDILTAYHKSEKVRDGIAFIAKPPETPAPEPVAPDPTTAGMLQAANAFLEISKINKRLLEDLKRL